VLLALCLVAAAVARLALLGWSDISPDDARYLYVGMTTLAGDGPHTPDGLFYVQRSPVYGIALALGGALVGDRLLGAGLVALTLSLVALVEAVWLAWRIAGSTGAVATSVALFASPLVWRLLPTMRIDLPQTAGVLGVLILLLVPSIRRAAAAGGVLGLTVLVKETVLLLGFLPLAAIGFVPRRQGRNAWLVYVGAAIAVAGWWWIVAWVSAGVVFPLNSIGVVENRDVAPSAGLRLYEVVLAGVMVAAWLVVARQARRRYPARLLLVAAACLVPPAVYAALNGLSERNMAGLIVLSTVAVGVAAEDVLANLWSRPAITRARRLAAALLSVAVVTAVVAGQALGGTSRLHHSPIPADVAAWLEASGERTPGAVIAFREREAIAIELFGRGSVRQLPIVPLTRGDSISDFLWIGLRDQKLFGLRRDGWQMTLGDPSTTHLVLAGPHPLTPAELLPALDAGTLPGVTTGSVFGNDDDWARAYVVDPALVADQAVSAPLHLAPKAASAWLDLAAAEIGEGEAKSQLAAARPVLVGGGRAALLDRLSDVACTIPSGEGSGRPQLIPRSEAVDTAGARCR